MAEKYDITVPALIQSYSPFLWLQDVWGVHIRYTFYLLDFLIPQQIFARQRLLNAFFTLVSVFDCPLFASLSSSLLSSITTHSSYSLFISLFLTLIYPSLLCPILIWLSRLLRALFFLSATSSPTSSIPISEFLR